MMWILVKPNKIKKVSLKTYSKIVVESFTNSLDCNIIIDYNTTPSLIEHNYILLLNVPLNHLFSLGKCILSSFWFIFFSLLYFKFFSFVFNLLIHYLLFQNCQLLVYVLTCELEQQQVTPWHGFSLLSIEALKIC